MTAFVKNLEFLSRMKGVALSGVVESLGMHASDLTRWRQGRVPTARTQMRFKQYFGVENFDISTDDFIDRYKDMPNEMKVVSVIGASTEADSITRKIFGVDEVDDRLWEQVIAYGHYLAQQQKENTKGE